jgi:mannose-6-phosphate isomerase-like protein (cupin superfamily)
MTTDNYNNVIVNKPWGFEYLVYQNDKVALWCLYIAKNEKTSMHCHPNKTTGLIVLDGACEINFLSNKFIVKELDKTMIRKSLFHSTKSIGDNGSVIFEIETPNDKYDLVRLDDNYGRVGLPYENSDFEIPKKSDCLWIDDNFNLSHNIFANCLLTIHEVKSSDFFKSLDDSCNFIVLSGGIATNYNINIINPGDIVNITIAKKIIESYNKILSNTFVLTFSKIKQ